MAEYGGLIPLNEREGDLTHYNSISPALSQQREYIQPDDDTRKAAQKTLEKYEYYLLKLPTVWQRWVKHWRLYMAARKETRGAKDRWRSRVHVPYPFSGIQTTVGSFLDVILSLDPPVKPSGIGPEDLIGEKKIERLIAYQMRKIDFPSELELFLIENFVQGLAFRKANWINDVQKVYVHPDQEQIADFEAAMVEAIQGGMPLPPGQEDPASGMGVANGDIMPGGAGGIIQPGQQVAGQPGQPQPEMSQHDQAEAFEAWRQEAIASGFQVPEAPIPGPTDITWYKGTGFTRVSAFDMIFDPTVGRWEDQSPFQRSVKSVRWLKQRAQGPNAPFDMQKLMNALGQGESGTYGSDTRVNSYQEEMLGMMGLSSTQGDDPSQKGDDRLVEVLTHWDPTGDFPYQVIVNRHPDLVNNIRISPYWHGKAPFVVGTNNRIPGMLPSMGELWQPERLYYEMDTLRGLRIDGVLLSILPMFVRLREAGMVEMAQKLIPGMLIEASRTDGIQQLTDINVPTQAFTEIDKIKMDIDETNATFPNVRGGAASGSGTTATEANRAFENAMVRTTQRILRFEGELTKWVRFSLFNWYQFADSEEKLRVGGEPGQDPFVSYKRKDFLEALDMDYAFVGARTAVNTAEEISQLKDLMITAINAQVANANIPAMFSRIAELASRDASQFTYTEEQMAEQQQQQQEDGANQSEAAPEEGAPEQ